MVDLSLEFFKRLKHEYLKILQKPELIN